MSGDHTRIQFCAWVCLLVFTVFNVLYAEEKSNDVTDVDAINLEDLLNVKIVSASKFAQKVNEAPSVVSVVTKEQVEKFGWRSINDILYRQAGFFPSQDYDRRTVGSRGLTEGWNNNHLLMLVDGVPFNDSIYGSAYTWEITPLFMVQSVEIIRGPGSALYGSNATNGVVNIKTLSPKDLEKSVLFRFRAGNFNSQSYDMIGGNETKLFSYVLGFNFNKTAGNEYDSYDGSGRLDADGKLEMFRVKDKRSNVYCMGKIEGKQALKGLDFQFHYQGFDFQTGHGWLWDIPDLDDDMNESRIMAVISYRPGQDHDLAGEYIVRYQRHNINWNLTFLPSGANNNFYPAGVTEIIKTNADEVFARAQLTYRLPRNANLLAGVEGNILYYNGDEEHFSNTDLNDEGGFFMDDGTLVPSHQGWFAPFPGNVMHRMGPLFEWIKDKPVKNVGVYTQFFSGDMLGKKLKATVGLRYDTMWFHFDAIDKVSKPEESKSFSRVSPRLGLVYTINPNLTIKAMAGMAFRTPSPTELFCSNTWVILSNLRQLKPEIITTYELALDWRLSKNLNMRLNAFHTKFENQIAYSVQNFNLSTNVYTLTSQGVEAELLFGFGKLNGFFNYSYTDRVDEKILDSTVVESKNRLTWAPAHVMNIGASYVEKKWEFSIQGHFQGKVIRRGTPGDSNGDFADSFFSLFRPMEVASWFQADARAAYRLSPVIELSVAVYNLFNSTNYLVKNFSYPFDYRMQKCSIFGGINIYL